MELNLAGVDEELQTPLLASSKPTKKSPDLDLSGVDTILSANKDGIGDKSNKAKKSSTIQFQPDLTDWDISKVVTVKDFFKTEFGRELPTHVGQQSIHNKWNYDHRNSMDIGVNPNSTEGQKIMSFLREKNIPFLAFTQKIEGVSTGPHIHVGRPSKKITEKISVGSIGELKEELDLSGVDEINQLSQEPSSTSQELNITGVKEIKQTEEALPIDPFDTGFKGRTPNNLPWEVKAAIGASQDSIPKIMGRNPDEMGDIVRTKISWNEATGNQTARRGKKPDVNTITDAWLTAWNPEYAVLNQQYRKETGGLNLALVDSPKNIKYIGNGEYEVRARTARGVQALFEAYKKGGLPAVVATNNLIEQQRELYIAQAEEEVKKIKEFRETHPYEAAVAAGIQSEVQSTAILANNLKYLGKALFTGVTKGYDSEEYTALINQEIADKEQIFAAQEDLHHPEDLTGKVVMGATAGVAMMPRLIVGQRLGINLPTMVYLENLHRGNREAALAALPMAVLVGAMHGAGQFLGGSSGTSAPFRRVTNKELSLFQDTLVKNVESPVTANLTPLERQLVLRGGNALAIGGTHLLANPHSSLEDVASQIIVGLTFPVGGAPKELFGRSITAEPTPKTEVKVPFQIGQRRIDVPITSPTAPIIEQTRGIDAADPLIASLEKGFQARTQGQNIQLDLDTANLNLIELKRALENGTYKNKGDDMPTSLQKQNAIKKAISVLEQAIPEETKQFFIDNEKAIREALRGNYEATKTKTDFLQKRLENIKPNDVRQADLPLPPDMESQRRLSTEHKNELLDRFFKVQPNELRSSVFGLDVLARKSADAAYIGAWYVEDFYLRGIKPTFDLVLNRLKTQFEGITDDAAKFIYYKGLHFYETNQADPFFSRMKQDAVEKLPNRFTVDQARNVLSQHVDEFEWTTGLKDFLDANAGRKINKQELIDIIQQGQVRVEESVADEKWVSWQDDPIAQRLEAEKAEILRDKYDYEKNKTRSQLEFATIEENQASVERALRAREKELENENRARQPKYSLRNYHGEKLELPGAKNSKEVKLISSYYSISQEGEILGRIDRYKGPHWDNLADVVAHYRSNDRVTIDNKRVYFGEEFQSDWAHDIREKGLITEGASRLELKEERISLAREHATASISRRSEINARLQEIDNLLRSGVEPMPFMGHNWKELIMKRFLRDAAIAKDENGNYKYDGVGWTTARQQQERYGKDYISRDFRWEFNEDDGTYTFEMKRANGEWATPHELEHISLERFKELTSEEAFNKVTAITNKNVKYEIYDKQNRWVSDERNKKEAEKELRRLNRDDEGYYIKTISSGKGKVTLDAEIDLRKGEGKYSDYDVSLVNIAKKVGKRFGATYSEKEIETDSDYTANLYRDPTASKFKKEKIHYLEITPSMRQSLEKEGLPLFGTGGNEPLTAKEIGIRNRITTKQGFDQHRNNLIKGLEKITDGTSDSGTVLNSGLNPDAFIDQARLLYRGMQDFATFSKEMIRSFGEAVRPFLQDLWIQVKEIGKDFQKSFDIAKDEVKNAKDSNAFKYRQSERGFFGRRQKTLAEEKYIESRKKVPYFEWYSLWRGVGLTQLSTEIGSVMDIMRQGQRVKNSFEWNVLQLLHKANVSIKGGLDQAVADSVWIGNEESKTYTNAELAAGDPTTGRPALNAKQIDAYRNIRKAIDLNLEHRRETKLYSLRERAIRLSAQLSTKTPGTPEYDNIANKLLDLADAINKVNDHYNDLKKSGYISTKRIGKIAAFTEDATGPIYQQFDSVKEAGIWLKAQEDAGADPLKSKMYDVRKIENLRSVAAKMTPAQFEDLIDAAGVNAHAPEIEKLRDEVYSRFPSFGYELKRDFVRGYDRNWHFMLESIANQTQIYANSRYARVSGNEGIKQLNATGLQANKYDAYQTLQKYIDHEISAPENSTLAKVAGMGRKGVYFFQLGFDINQLWLNALAQPMTQTYSYFARVSHNGVSLKGLEPEQYFVRGWKLANQVAKDYIRGTTTVDPNFEAIRKRLIAEDVIGAEFNKDLLELETDKTTKTKLQKLNRKSVRQNVEHWAGVFMRAGEKTTRTHVAAEAYLVGKEKFGLAGDDLVNFIVRAVDATQTNPSRAETPLAIRGRQNQGEIRKLAYQFNAFNHMWAENLALNVRADYRNNGINILKYGATQRHLAPLILMGGIAGLPLAGFAGTLYRLITGDDPRKHFDKMFGKDSFIERLALYGITTDATIAGKVTPSVPFLDQARIGDTLGETISETASISSIPAFATAGQILKGFDDLFIEEDQKLRGLGELLPVKPMRNVATALRYNEEGIRTRGGKTIVPKQDVTAAQKFKQVLGIAPSPLVEYYERKKSEKTIKLHKKISKPLKKKLKSIL